MRCQFVVYGQRERVHRMLPRRLRYSRWVRFVQWKTIRCKNVGVALVTGASFDGYNGLTVCMDHLRDVELSNEIDKAIRKV